MSKLENLLLPVTFNNWNTYTYSPRINTLLSLSPNMGAMPKDFAYLPEPPTYLFDPFGLPMDNDDLVSRCKEIDGSDDLESALENMLKDMLDIEGEPILDSNFKFTLPYAFKYSQARETSLNMFSLYCTDDPWMSLLEYKTAERFDPDVTVFTYKSNVADIDLLLNEYLEKHIDLIKSDNYLLDIIKELALRSNESIDEEKACDYFINKPFRMLILAADKGINYIIENGYKEYKNQLLENYKMEESHREQVPFMYPTRLFNIDYINKASIAYDNMCNRLDVTPNWNLFEEWHSHQFKDCNNTEDAVVNTIVRLSTGYDFTLANWNYFQQAVYDFAIEEHDNNEYKSKTFKEWLSDRR